VFASDLKQVGDVRRLEGRQIEIDGEIKSYDGRAEIILSRSSQLRGDAATSRPYRKTTTWNATANTARERFAIPSKPRAHPARSSRPQ